MQLPPEDRTELAAIAASVRAHLEAERELAGLGLARAQLSALAPSIAAGSTRPIVPAPSGRPIATALQQQPTAARVIEPAATDPGPARVVGEERIVRLAQLARDAAACTRCVLHEKRNKSVFARGNPEAELVFVGEGPGRDEDAQGLPFVGAAGQLLDRMIVAMGYARDDVYICNVVKCRPPENRTPRPEESLACAAFLVPQLELVAPKAIVALGRCAAQALGVAESSGSWRGRWGTWRGTPILPTYHPAFLLRSPEFKRTVWEDLQLVMARLGRTPASRAT